MTPPASGAITGAIRPGQTMYDIRRMICDFSACPSTTMRPTGTIIAPPAPCRIRSATSSPSVALIAQPSEASVKTRIAERNTGRGPKRAVIQPLSGIRTASVSR
jgi:hypothetical protein